MRDPKFLAVDINVHGWADEGAIAEEGVDGDDNEDGGFLPFWPLNHQHQHC